MIGGPVQHGLSGESGRTMGELTLRTWRAVATAGAAGVSGEVVREMMAPVPSKAIASKLKDLRVHGYITRSGPKIHSVWSLDRACRAPRGEVLPAWVATLTEPAAGRLADEVVQPVSPKVRVAKAAVERAIDPDDDDGRMGVVAAGTTQVQMPVAPASIFTVGTPNIRVVAPLKGRLPVKAELNASTKDAPVVLGWKAPDPCVDAAQERTCEPDGAIGFGTLPPVPEAAYAANALALRSDSTFQCSIDNEGYFYLFFNGQEIGLPFEQTRKLVRYVECLGGAVIAALEGAAP